MPTLTRYERGTWNATCDQCGRGFKFYELKLRWDGAWVCQQCWEPRFPQDFLRAKKDDMSVPVSRPRILPNNTVTTLGATITASSLSLAVATGTGTNFPTGAFHITITSETDITLGERIAVGGHIAGSDSFTALTRGYGGSTPLPFNAGALISLL